MLSMSLADYARSNNKSNVPLVATVHASYPATSTGNDGWDGFDIVAAETHGKKDAWGAWD